VSFALDFAKIALIGGQPMTVTAAGKLLDEPFKLKFSGGSLHGYLTDQPWPLELIASGAGAQLALNGTIAPSTDPHGSNLKFQISGKRISDLSAWLGVSRSAQMSYSAGGQMVLAAKGWELNSLKAHVGKTKLAGTLGWKGTIDKPLIEAKLRLEDVDVDELERIFVTEQPEAKKETAVGGINIDVPIIPQQVTIYDADIDIAVSRVYLPTFQIADISLTSRIRNGFVDHAPFQAAIGKVMFKGELGFDLRGKMPEIKLEVNSSQVDIGELLHNLNIAEGIKSNIGRLGVKLAARGHNLSTMLDQSEFAASMQNGLWTLQDPSTDASLDIQIIKGIAQASAGQPVMLSLDSRIQETPFKINIESEKLKAFVDHPERIPLHLLIEGSGVNLDLSSTVTLPITQGGQEFRISLTGDRLDSVNEFLDLDLPPFGPYAVDGRFGRKGTEYYLSDLNVRVGQSEMIGNATLETAAQRPQLNVDLTTKTLQINDFKTEDWSLFEDDEVETEDAAMDMNKTDEAHASKDEQEAHHLLSPEVMNFLDARLSLRVEEVLSGKDKLGSGTFKSVLREGRLVVDPLQLDLPGGSALITFAFEPTQTDVNLEAAARIEQFDYGVLARRIKPESDMRGWLSLDLELKTMAKNLDAIMHNANGYIDFAIVPEDFEAGIFDLWTVNLLTTVLPKLDSKSESVINCLVFRFNLKDGRLKHDAIFLDTTKMQVAGEAKVDFKTEKVYLVLAPKAKRPEFFSLETPIKVDGTFADFKVGVKPGGLVGTAIRFITSPIHVPIRRLTKDKIPPDDKAACAEAMHRPHN
jgi:uncharacterized protein involved in outer membrane biogenesis